MSPFKGSADESKSMNMNESDVSSPKNKNLNIVNLTFQQFKNLQILQTKSSFCKRPISKPKILEQNNMGIDMNSYKIMREYLNESERVLRMILKNLKNVS